MGKVTVSEDSYIRNLPFSAFRKLMAMLDIGKEWEKMVVCIPKELDMTPENFEPKYGFEQVANFAERGRKYNGSATEAILRDWQTQNATIKHLINVLVEAKLFAAADYLSVKVLNGNPVPKPGFTQVENNLGLPVPSKREQDVPREMDSKDIDLGDINLPTPCRKPSDSDTKRDRPTASDTSKPSEGKRSSDTVVNQFEDYKSEAGSEGVEGEPENNICESILREQNEILKHVTYSTLENITNKFNEDDVINGGNLLGKGGFGFVFLGIFQSNFHVAIKRLKPSSEVEIDVKKQFDTERHYLTKYRQDNIVQLLGYSNDGPYKCLIYQYMENGSLEDRLLLKNGTPPLTPSQRVVIVKGTAEGIAFLNNHGLVHRDIKSANILLDKKFLPKLADFATTRTAPQGSGLSKCLSTALVIGTSAYLAPEAIQHDVSAKLDSFSFGVVLYEILTGLPAYDDEREDKDLKSHIDENCDNITNMLDISGGEWEEKTVNVIYDVARRFVEHKRRRLLVSDVIEDLRKL